MSKNSSNNLKIKRYFIGYMFMLPSICLLIIWFYIPVIWTCFLSFQNWDGYLAQEWVGLQNYTNLLKDEVATRAIFNSVSMALTQTAFAVAIGIVMAVFIFVVTKKEGTFYRLVFFMPSMIPTAIIGVLFIFVYNYDFGIINNLLRVLGLDFMAKAWLEESNTVISSINFVNIWKNSGITMMLTYASLTMIPESFFEASKLEGASYRTQIFKIMLPLAKPIMTLSTLYTLSLGFKTFDTVFTLTRGGPANLSMTVPLYMSLTSFQYGQFGYAASMGVILTVLVVLIFAVINKAAGGEYFEY